MTALVGEEKMEQAFHDPKIQQEAAEKAMTYRQMMIQQASMASGSQGPQQSEGPMEASEASWKMM